MIYFPVRSLQGKWITQHAVVEDFVEFFSFFVSTGEKLYEIHHAAHVDQRQALKSNPRISAETQTYDPAARCEPGDTLHRRFST